MEHPIYIIVAVDEKNGIGKNGRLPWKLKKEYKYFRETTCKTNDPSKLNMVIMGHRTWDSLDPAYQPLPGRRNIILTKDSNYKVDKDAIIYNSLEEAIATADESIGKIFILGGGKVFEQAINNPGLTGIYLTKIHKTFDCDTFFPKIPAKFSKVKKIDSAEENGVRYDCLLYEKASV